jgi:hypothetical protein
VSRFRARMPAIHRHRPPRARLTHDWQVWVADNLLRGAKEETVADRLIVEGVPPAEARLWVREVGRSAAMMAARRRLRRGRQLELVLRLQETLARSGGAPSIERRPYAGADDFFARHWATCTPVVFTDFMREWPALHRWTPSYFRERFGAVEIEATDGRDRSPEYDIHFARHRRPMTMGDFVDRITSQGPSNDLYLIANNRNLAREGLQPIFDDLVLPTELFDPTRISGGSALWFGPAGTVTALHHDTSNILFCQVLGRKRLHLAPPTTIALLDRARGVYSTLDPESDDPILAEIQFRVVDVGPGDALFIPAGWWHHVRALELSISLALNNFTRPNAYPWFKPGSLTRSEG